MAVSADQADHTSGVEQVDVEERRAVCGAVPEQHDVAGNGDLRRAIPRGGNTEVGDRVEIRAGAHR